MRGPDLKPEEVNQLIAKLPNAADTAELKDICSKLRNKADAAMDAKDRPTYDQIYSQLIDVGIALQLAGRISDARSIYSHLCTFSENGRPAYSSPLQQEAAIRMLIIDYPGRIDDICWKDPEGQLRQMYATAASTPGRSMPKYELGKMYQEGKPEGMEQSHEKSMELYRQAIAEGCPLSEKALINLENTIKADAIQQQLHDQKMAEEKALMEQRDRELREVANNLKSRGHSQKFPDWYDDHKTYGEKLANTR